MRKKLRIFIDRINFFDRGNRAAARGSGLASLTMLAVVAGGDESRCKVAQNYSQHTDDIAFIDLEASGLGVSSWPIEVGWCGVEGEATSLLIKPREEWVAQHWDDEAERLHGLSIAELQANGEEPKLVCAALNAALKGKRVFCDAPDWDGFWLYRLFGACNVRQEFSLLAFSSLIGALNVGNIDQLVAQAEREFPHKHRAGADVRHMQAVFALARAKANAA